MNIFKKIYCRVFQFCFALALPILPYYEPKLLNSMSSLAAELKERGHKSVLIVTDAGLMSLGLTDNLCAELAKTGIEYAIYSDTVPNPTIHNVEAAREMYLQHKCDCVIGFGGGSPIDCAKAVGARIAKPNKSIPQMEGIMTILKKTPLIVAIPTTAGTGSETTLAMVITDSEKHHKYPISDFSLIPSVAVHDCDITLGLPKHITATTGMDALTHAVEAYIGGMTNEFTRQMAEEATTLIRQYLKRAYDNGQDREAREKMLRASYCAGNAFTRSCVGYVHGVAHSLGGQYGVPHGLANAVILPYFLEEYGTCCESKLGQLARRSGIAPESSDDHAASQTFIQWIKDMNRDMGLPDKIEGIKDEDIPVMSKHADKECNPLYPVPKLMDAQELEKMYHRIAAPAK